MAAVLAFAARAAIAYLVMETFPQAHSGDDDLTGVSSALGGMCAALIGD